MQGIIVLIVYALLMVGATKAFTKREDGGESFHVGHRNMGMVVSAMSIAATWIWAPALFTSAEKAYWHCRAVLVFSAEYFMPDPVHSICKKNPAGYAGRNHAFRVYAQEIQVRAGEESISLSAHSAYNPVNCSSTVSRRQDTEYGNGLTIMGYDYRTGSHSFFLFADFRNQGFCLYGRNSDGVPAVGMRNLRSMGIET